MQYLYHFKKAIFIVMITFGILFLLGHNQTIYAQENSKSIAHGGGFIEGHSVTNSLEAVQNSISNGFQYIELDMNFTSDGEIAMIHDWENSAGNYLGINQNRPISYAEYQKCKIFEKYTPLTMDSLSDLLAKNPTVSIITDTKEDNIKLLTLIKNRYPQMLNQMIPQVYSYLEWEAVKALGYQNIILTVYKMSDIDVQQLLAFSQEKGLFAVTVSAEFVGTGLLGVLQENGVKCYVHTLNSLDQVVKAVEEGAYGVYTDFLIPEEIETTKWKYYLTETENLNEEVLNLAFYADQPVLRFHGKNDTDYVRFYLNEKFLMQSKVNVDVALDLSELEDGLYPLQVIAFYADGTQIAQREYFISKNGNLFLIASKQYCYIFDQMKPIRSLEEVASSYSSRVQEILRESFIVRVGSPIYYYKGKVNVFLNGSSLLSAIKEEKGNILIPFYDTAVTLGASEVYFNEEKGMNITYSGQKYHAIIAGLTGSMDANITNMQSDMVVYQNKAMTGGKTLKNIFKIDYIQSGEVMILLPRGTQMSDSIKKGILEAASDLYKQE